MYEPETPNERIYELKFGENTLGRCKDNSIVSGKVAAGNIGSDKLIQYAHIGDKPNVGSRICSAAEADKIVISQRTFDKLTNQSLPLEKLPPIMVKGKDQPLQLYRLFGSKYPQLLLI
jgi:class 3 adenylate cyclase